MRQENIEKYREYDWKRYHTDPSRRDRSEWYYLNKEKALGRSAEYARLNKEKVRKHKKNMFKSMDTIPEDSKELPFHGAIKKELSLFILSEIG